MLFWCQNKGKIKSKKSKMKNQKKSMIVGSAIMICEKYHPLCKEEYSLHSVNKGQRQMIISTLIENPDYCKDLVSYYNEQMFEVHSFVTSLCHDIVGLYQNDPHFLPRIS
tara:strand:+ start:729 stop:1058 length:330 start_codon:yes stop_codon:yes gene_type:complete